MAKRAAILNIGTELLVGHVLNTHAQYLTKWLNHMGYGVYYHLSCGDNLDRIDEALQFLSQKADLILVTGGLGPTQDDLTRQAIANFSGCPLYRDQRVVDRIDNQFTQWGRKATINNYLQADFPRGAHILENPKGTAPGFALQTKDLCIACLPGPPIEVKAVVEGALTAYLAPEGMTLYSAYITLYGIGESALDEAIADIFEAQVDPTIGIYASEGQLTLRLSTLKADEGVAQALFDPLIEVICDRVAKMGNYIVSTQGLSVPEVLMAKLLEKKMSLALAESCTGGLVSKMLTDIPGASAVIKGSVVSYANDVKESILNVASANLINYGAVSEQVAIDMARGVLNALDVDAAISITGIAGPDGGTADKPLGTVYIAYALKDGTTSVSHHKFVGDRQRVRLHAALTAMKGLLNLIN